MDFHFVFKQNMSQRHPLVTYKSVPALLGDADMALNVTTCILIFPASLCSAAPLGSLARALYRGEQAQEVDYHGAAWQSPRRPAVPFHSERSPK